MPETAAGFFLYCSILEASMTLAALVPTFGDGRRQQGRQVRRPLLLEGRPVLAHTLERLERCPRVDSIFPVVSPGEREYVEAQVLRGGHFPKVREVIEGGLLYQDSLHRALTRIGVDWDLIMIHDGHRPLVSDSLLLRTIEAAEIHGAAVATVPAHDPLKTVNREHFVVSSYERRRTRALQTPQVYRSDMLHRAHKQAAHENYYASDEATLVERLGERIKTVSGSVLNLYVITREDLVLAQALLHLERTGSLAAD